MLKIYFELRTIYIIYIYSSYNYKSNSSEPKESYEFADLY